LLSEAEAVEAGAAPLAVAAPVRIGVGTGYLLAALAALLFSTKSIAVKIAYEQGVDTETLLALRMGLALPVYLVIGGLALFRRRQKGAPFPASNALVRAAGIGVLGYWFASYTDFLGLSYISAQFERLILFTYPIFVVLIGAAFFGHSIERRVIVSIAFSYAGLALIFAEKQAVGGSNVILGTGFVLVSALAFALYQLLAKPEIARLGAALFTCVAMCTASVVALVLFLATHEMESLRVSAPAFFSALFLAIGATVLPTFLMNAALQRISAQANATIGNFSPVATIILAVIVLGETLTPMDVAGTILVLGGIGWFTLGAGSMARGQHARPRKD
jgi:drug/metabolite transporter (DMT)-like permease